MSRRRIYDGIIILLVCAIIACVSFAFIEVNYTYAAENTENSYVASEEVPGDPLFIYTEINNYGGVNLGQQRIQEGDYNTSNLYYIENANYFLANPKHNDNLTTDNPQGTCTTVAMQMLLGYHNYYSDRRLIPETDENGVRFLSEDYGDLNQHPDIMPLGNKEPDLGRASIGTENEVFYKIFEAADGSSDLGQAIPVVKGAASSFLSKYADPAVEWTLQWNLCSESSVKEELFAGRPIILGFNFFLTGFQSSHVVVAYGYAEIDGKPGYITHFGWKKPYVQMWVPADLMAFEMTMSVNHTHTYPDSGVNKTDAYREVTCNVCGADLLENIYELNQVGDTIVGCNFDLTGTVTVPSQINGIAIKSIDNAVFENQNITSITLPSSITSIGTNSFKNCKSLATVTAPGLQQVGDGAFEGCSNLTTVDFLETVQSIGNNAFENCSKLANIPSMDNVQFIGANAFKDCSSLTNINLPSGLLNIGDNAFSGCDNLSITVSAANPNYCAEGNILYSKNKTELIAAGNIASTVTLPESVSEISPYAFEGNSKLVTVHIKNCPTIGQYAFANCENLRNVYFYTYTVPEVEINAFLNDNFTLYVPHSSQQIYNHTFSVYLISIASMPITITYVGDGQVIQTLNTYFGATISGQPTPFKLGYDFIGWYENEDGSGVEYANGNLWDMTEGKTVYAKWEPRKFYIIFDGYGSEGLPDKEVTYDAPIGPLPVIEPEEGEFLGWKNSKGEYYTEDKIWKDLNNVTLTSDIFSESYTVVLDKQSGTGGSDQVNAIYLEPMPSATAPTRTGYEFKGYFTEPDGKGTKYYNEDMTSAKDWDIQEDRTLYAYWEGEKYTLTLNNQFTEKFKTNLVSISSNDIKYITFVPKTSGTTTLYTSHTEGDPYLILYDKNFNILAYNDDGYGNRNSTITYNFISGERYIIGFRAVGNILTVGQVRYSGTFSITYTNIFAEIEVTYGSEMPTDKFPTPTKTGNEFIQYNTDTEGQGTSYYYGPNLSSESTWDRRQNCTLYAIWEKESYNVTLNTEYLARDNVITVQYGEEVTVSGLEKYVYNRIGYDFQGFYSEPDGDGIQYFDFKVVNRLGDYCYELESQGEPWLIPADGEIYAYWTVITVDYEYEIIISNADEPRQIKSIEFTHGGEQDIIPEPIDGYKYQKMWLNGKYEEKTCVKLTNIQLKRNLGYKDDVENGVVGALPVYLWYPTSGYPVVNKGGLFMVYEKETCLAAGTKITLADGTQKPVEDLTGDEMLLVWNLLTGKFDIAPVVFIDSHSAMLYKVINLHFSDGTLVKVISEHAFWDLNLNRYVYLREDAAQYIGHWFYKQGENGLTKVQLTDVVIREEYTTAWSPVTREHLCYFVNGMLSIPGAIDGLFNIFEVDAETMMYNKEQMEADIAQYGLYTYEEFNAIIRLPEEIFDAFNVQYFKVAIGKGMLTLERVGQLIDHYSVFF